MSYPGPSGPPGGYGPPPQQGGGSVFGQPPAAPNPLSRLSMPSLLTLLVFVLGLVAYFCSFGGGVGIEVETLLAGGLLAGLALLPKAPNTLPFATVLSVVGGLGVLDGVINGSNAGIPTGVILILVVGLVQAIVSVVALLLEYGAIKLAPRPAVPHGAPNYPGGGYPPPPPGQPGPHQPGPPPGSQGGTQYMTPQGTQYLQHPGQLSHQNPPE
jgi:hypothetical protein